MENNGCLEKVSIVFGLVGFHSGVFSDSYKLKTASHFRDEPPKLSFSGIITCFNIDKIDFLKVDIEGSEFNLFNGDTGWLSKIDKIAMEVHPEFGNIKSLGNFLKNKRFKVWYVDGNQQIVDELTSTGLIFAKNLHPLQVTKDESE